MQVIEEMLIFFEIQTYISESQKILVQTAIGKRLSMPVCFFNYTKLTRMVRCT